MRHFVNCLSENWHFANWLILHIDCIIYIPLTPDLEDVQYFITKYTIYSHSHKTNTLTFLYRFLISTNEHILGKDDFSILQISTDNHGKYWYITSTRDIISIPERYRENWHGDPRRPGPSASATETEATLCGRPWHWWGPGTPANNSMGSLIWSMHLLLTSQQKSRYN